MRIEKLDRESAALMLESIDEWNWSEDIHPDYKELEYGTYDWYLINFHNEDGNAIAAFNPLTRQVVAVASAYVGIEKVQEVMGYYRMGLV